MTAISYINGYEVLALPANKFNSSVEMNEYRADLSDGFRVQSLYGASTGTRSWNLGFNALRNKSTPDVTDNDLEMSAAKYIYDLFIRTKNSGQPFVVQDSLFNQYYLCEFADSRLSFEQIFTTLFSTGLNLRQVRLPNITVFQPSSYSQVSHWHKTPITGATDNATLPGGEWVNSTTGDDLTSTGATYQTGELNGKAIVRLDQSGSAQYLTSPNTVFYEVFLLMKVRESAFSDYVGIVSNNHSTAGSPALIGDSGTTKFFDLSLGSGYEYRKNGVLYNANNQQAPMNTYGVVHIRRADGFTMPNGIVFGIDRLGTFPNRKANIDIAEIIVSSELLPVSVGLEITEHLTSYL